MKCNTELIDKAVGFLQDKGYTIVHASPGQGANLIVHEKGNQRKVIFVAVMNGDGVYPIPFPMHGLGKSKKAIFRMSRLLKDSVDWIKQNKWNGSVRFDALWIPRAGSSVGISHCININLCV